MEERTRIGFYYVWDSSWMGGVMYARNLLKALNTLEDKDKPFIDVYCRKKESYEDLKVHTEYPYMEMNIINDESLCNKVYRKIIGFLGGEVAKAKVDRFRLRERDTLIYPYAYGRNVSKLVFWRPDFQEKYLPEFFTEKSIKNRDLEIRTMASRGVPIVFSSYDSENDYRKFYPEYSNKTFVVHFAVDHSDFSSVDINEIKERYGIKGDYLLCANQFWKHKNHLFLFKAYRKALQQGLNLQLVCTGRLSDFRNPDYIEEIKTFISDNDLSSQIVLPGLINSNELHSLMKNSYAVVQPSLFEGWNTTVEDCKALNKFIFLSDLPVHREQAKTNVCFFDPHNEHDLCEKLMRVKPIEETFDYSYNLREFGENFLKVIRYVKSKSAAH